VSELEKLGITALAWLVIAVAAGLVCMGLWVMLPAASRRLFPLPRWRPVLWTGPDVLAAFLLIYLVPGLLFEPLNRLGLITLLYGAEGSLRLQREREFLLVQALAVPIQVTLVLTGLAVLRGAGPARVGLARRRFVQNIAVGYLTWLTVTPPALLLHVLLSLVLKSQAHPLERVSQLRLFEWEWGVIVFLAVIGAPLLEELVFRGVLLPWQLGRTLVDQLIVGVVALIIAILLGIRDGSFNPGPMLFILAMLPGYALVPYLDRQFGRGRSESRPQGGAREGVVDQYTPPRLIRFVHFALEKRVNVLLAVYGNALLFAAFHSSVWPTPIPLFFLSLGLGWLAYRSRSLVAPIVTHVLFNSVATLYLFLT
jgi:membrane protease YdiL (CAAX protease family)